MSQGQHVAVGHGGNLTLSETMYFDLDSQLLNISLNPFPIISTRASCDVGSLRHLIIVCLFLHFCFLRSSVYCRITLMMLLWHCALWHWDDWEKTSSHPQRYAYSVALITLMSHSKVTSGERDKLNTLRSAVAYSRPSGCIPAYSVALITLMSHSKVASGGGDQFNT